ncbi:hypothetical protein ABW19_dt0202635 [Dactylella cylindrospora]|nr:hypothetical protein ABW19_dt0202635 [Dactylella cylindrospora]
MAKRPYNQSNTDRQDRRQGPTPKKQRKDDSLTPKAKVPESINSVRQLQGLFAEYNNAGRIQEGIQSFKKFLAECRDLQYTLHFNEEHQLCILQEYLDTQTSQEAEETCNDLMQAWSFASQSNNFHLLSSIPTALHLLLRTVSLFPNLRRHGIALCKTILQPPYLKLVYRSLAGNKDSICAPCLRLLTEINKFDNGSQCALLHQSMDFTVKDLGRNLDVKKTDKSDVVAVEDPDRPGVRTVFVRFILSFFQYAPAGVKTDIMGLRMLTTPLFKYIRQDTAVVVAEVLTTFKKYIIDDQDISRSAKTNYFNDWSLSRLAELCYRDDPISLEIPDRTVADVIFEFLSNVCTTPGNGVCFQDSGWYTGVKIEGASEERSGRGVNNRILLGLLKSLRPYSNTYHLRLLVDIFAASPELVAAYWNDNTSFTFEPKLTATWIGLSSIVLESIQIRVPLGFGYQAGVPTAPPPLKNVVENILPQQLTRAVLTKCLTYNNYLVKFLSVRILNAAFRKLGAVLDMLYALSADLVDTTAWSKASYDIVDEFSRRVPEISTVITTFNQTPENGALQREAASKLLFNYHEYLSSTISGGNQKFDFGGAFGKILGRIYDSEGFEALETRNCMRLAKVLPETRWWGKIAAGKYSPAVGLMRVYTESHYSSNSQPSEGRRDIYELLEKIVDDSPLFGKNEAGGVHPLEALIESLEYVKGGEGWERVFEYLDNACGRLTQSPYKFYDIIGEIKARYPERKASPILAALFHQFKFVDVTKETEGALRGLCRWLLRLANNLWIIGEITVVEPIDAKSVSSEGGNGGDVYLQHLDGLKSWRCCLGRFKIGWRYDIEDLTDVLMELQSSSAKAPLPIGDTLASLRLAAKRPSRPSSILYWRYLQKIIEMLLDITTGVTEESMDSETLEEWAKTHFVVFSVYEKAAGALPTGSCVDRKRAAFLDVMTGQEAKLIAANCFANGITGRLWFPLDGAIMKIYSEIPITPIEDTSGIKYSLYRNLVKACEDLGLALGHTGAMGSLLEDRLALFLKKFLDVHDLKYILREASSQGHKLPDLAWNLIFGKLHEGGETLTLKEALSLLSVAGGFLGNPWSRFLKYCSSNYLNDGQSSDVGFATVYDIIIDKSAVAFANLVEVMLSSNYIKGLNGLVENLGRYLSKTEYESGDRVWKGEFAELVFPVCNAAKSTLMERGGNGKLRWKLDGRTALQDNFTKILYSDSVPGEDRMSRISYVLQEKPWTEGNFVGYFEIGLDLGQVPWDDDILTILDIPSKNEISNPSVFGLFEAAYRASEGTDLAWFHTKLQKIVYTLTVQLSDPEPGSSTLEFCERLGDFLRRSELDLVRYATEDAVSSLLDVAFEKIGRSEVVGLAAGVIDGIGDIEDLQQSKLLQSLLSSSSAALHRRPQSSHTSPSEECLLLAFILSKLFFESKRLHSTITTLDGILQLYRGTNDVIDAILLEIVMVIEGQQSRSIMERIVSISFSDDTERHMIERDNKGRLSITINPKMLQRSIIQFYPKKAVIEAIDKDDLADFLQACGKFGEEDERSATYDVTFISSLVMHGISVDDNDQKLEIKDIIEKNALSYVMLGLSSEEPEERAMAEAVLTAIVSKLEGSGAWGYKERTEVIHLIGKILASIQLPDSDDSSDSEDSEEGEKEKDSIKHCGIPTITALFLSRALSIVSNPSHPLYEKVMRWLQSRSLINLNEIPLLREFLRSEEEGYWKEVLWMLEALADGIKGRRDVEVLRKRGVWEEVMGLYTSAPSGLAGIGGDARKEKGQAIKKKILDVLWNTAGVEGGATTLITRTGVVSWVKMMVLQTAKGAEGEEERVMLKRLVGRVWEACDKEYVKEWGGGNIGRVMEGLVGPGLVE